MLKFFRWQVTQFLRRHSHWGSSFDLRAVLSDLQGNLTSREIAVASLVPPGLGLAVLVVMRAPCLLAPITAQLKPAA